LGLSRLGSHNASEQHHSDLSEDQEYGVKAKKHGQQGCIELLKCLDHNVELA
jgi:hypothetical protein